MIYSVMLLASLASTALALNCHNFDSNMGATYDLLDLQRAPEDQVYSVVDGDLPCTTKVEQNFTYLFNICGAVSTGIPRSCKGVDGVESAGALQINTRGTFDTKDDYCYLVGTYSDATTKVELLDQEDPTVGMAVTYHGAYCDDNTQRRFRIELTCADKLNPIPTHALEYSHCIYTVTMPSVYGCPMECPVSNRKLCAGNGHCSYDDDASSARCFCNNGYTGADCATATSSSTTLNYSPVLLGLIITLFVIVCMLVGGLLFMIKQISAYKEDMAHYQVLKGSDEDTMSSGVVV